MQRIILTIVLLLGFVTVKSQSTNLTGKWIGIEKRDTSLIEFNSAGFVLISGEFLEDEETIGGKNYPYETIEGDTIWVDLKYKTDPKNPNYLCFIMYRTKTDTPYLIMPLFMNAKSPGVMELSYLEIDEYADESGLLYTSPADWDKVDKYIADAKTASLQGPLPNTVVLTRTK